MVRVVEVAARDGLQAVRNRVLGTEVKVELVRRLVEEAGVRSLDVASFVSPAACPQLSDGAEVLAGLRHLRDRTPDLTLTCIVPNHRGMLRAIDAGATSVSIWVHGSDAFSLKNLRMSTAEHMRENEKIARLAEQHRIPLRGYISGAIHCPFSGPVAPSRVAQLASELNSAVSPLLQELVIADTLGRGTIAEVGLAVNAARSVLPSHIPLGLHLHNTFGYALGCIAVAVQDWNIRSIESSVSALGGCPYAGPQSLGNVGTEDVVHMLHAMGYETGLKVDSLLETGAWLCQQLGIEQQSFLSRIKSTRT